MEKDLLLVTGASGYIASWIVYYALQKGYRVRGTVRDPNNEKKVKHLKALPGASERLELVALDLVKASDETYANIIQGVTLLAHTASPFPSAEPKDENELIKPAVEGTTGILKAALNSKTIRAVVVTSSVVAIGEGVPVEGQQGVTNAGEKDWTNVDTAQAYPKSKTLAEQSAWKLYEDNKPSWSLCTINPGFVQGPGLSNEVTTSTELIVRFLSGQLPLVPHLSFPIVDVRDVAKAHLLALDSPKENVVGRRFILNNNTFWMKEIANAFSKSFGDLGYRFPKLEAPYWVIWSLSFFDKGLKLILPQIGTYVKFDNQPSKDILRVQYLDIEKTFADAGHSAIYHGQAPKSSSYKPPVPDWTPLNAA